MVFKTRIDDLYDLVLREKQIELDRLASMLGLTVEQTQELVKLLEKEGLVKVYFPTSPFSDIIVCLPDECPKEAKGLRALFKRLEKEKKLIEDSEYKKRAAAKELINVISEKKSLESEIEKQNIEKSKIIEKEKSLQKDLLILQKKQESVKSALLRESNKLKDKLQKLPLKKGKQVAKAKQSIAKQEKYIKSLEKEAHDLQSKYESLQKELEKISQSLEKITNQILEEKNRLDHLNSTYFSLKNKIQSLDQQKIKHLGSKRKLLSEIYKQVAFFFAIAIILIVLVLVLLR
ncbi:MAG: hypothetical protein QW735_03125 [archaeon]